MCGRDGRSTRLRSRRLRGCRLRRRRVRCRLLGILRGDLLHERRRTRVDLDFYHVFGFEQIAQRLLDLRKKALFDLAFNEVSIDGGEQETHTRRLRLHASQKRVDLRRIHRAIRFDLFDNGLPGFIGVVWIHVYSSRLPSVDGIEIIAANPPIVVSSAGCGN